jgi:hypothetical protein
MTSLTTPLTKLLGIKHPVISAGMNVASGCEREREREREREKKKTMRNCGN